MLFCVNRTDLSFNSIPLTSEQRQTLVREVLVDLSETDFSFQTWNFDNYRGHSGVQVILAPWWSGVSYFSQAHYYISTEGVLLGSTIWSNEPEEEPIRKEPDDDIDE